MRGYLFFKYYPCCIDRMSLPVMYTWRFRGECLSHSFFRIFINGICYTCPQLIEVRNVISRLKLEKFPQFFWESLDPLWGSSWKMALPVIWSFAVFLCQLRLRVEQRISYFSLAERREIHHRGLEELLGR